MFPMLGDIHALLAELHAFRLLFLHRGLIIPKGFDRFFYEPLEIPVLGAFVSEAPNRPPPIQVNRFGK